MDKAWILTEVQGASTDKSVQFGTYLNEDFFSFGGYLLSPEGHYEAYEADKI